METHIITVLAEDKPGVLARMTIMFGRRGINLISVTASPSLKEGLSRLMLVVHGNDKDVEKMQKHLANLVEIVSIKTLAKDDIVRELCLIKIKEKDKKDEYDFEIIGGIADFKHPNWRINKKEN